MVQLRKLRRIGFIIVLTLLLVAMIPIDITLAVSTDSVYGAAGGGLC